jgi:hypothetical protein
MGEVRVRVKKGVMKEGFLRLGENSKIRPLLSLLAFILNTVYNQYIVPV